MFKNFSNHLKYSEENIDEDDDNLIDHMAVMRTIWCEWEEMKRYLVEQSVVYEDGRHLRWSKNGALLQE